MAYPLVPSFPSGIGPPNAWVINITSGPTGVDLTTVSAVTLDAFRTQDLSRATWNPTILGAATATSLNVQLAFTGAEITTLGPYEIAVTLTTPGGMVPSSAIACISVDAHVLPPSPFLPGASTLVTPIAGIPGLSALAAHAVMVGTGVATIGVVGPGGSGVPLLGAGANADPVFAPINLAGGTSVLSGLLPVSNQAIISVTNAAALAALPTSAMSPGQAATVQSIQQTFRLNPSSTVVPDNVSYISAQNGGNWVSSLTVPSGRSITALQGGLVSAPAVEAPLLIQPANLSRAPFGHSLSTHFFNGVDDNTCNWGYNPAFDGTGTEPNAVLNIEADFSSLPGVHQLEMYFATTMPGVGQAVRPMGFVLNRVTGEVTCSIQYAGGGLILVGGTIAGPPHTEINFADGSMSFPNGNYTIQSTGGALSLIANANMTLGCNSFMEITIAAGNVWALDTDIGSFRVAAGTEVCAFDTTVSAFRLYPHTDSTGSIGLNAKRWGLVRGLVVSSGDLDLCDEERGAHWTLREEPDCILAVNRVTDEWYKLPLAPLSQEERSRYESVPLKSEHLDAEAMVAVLKARRAA